MRGNPGKVKQRVTRAHLETATSTVMVSTHVYRSAPFGGRFFSLSFEENQGAKIKCSTYRSSQKDKASHDSSRIEDLGLRVYKAFFP